MFLTAEICFNNSQRVIKNLTFNDYKHKLLFARGVVEQK